MSGRNDPPRFEYAAGEVSLPFSYLVQVSDAPRPAGLDFSHEPNPDNCQVFVRIEDELWQFRCPWIIGKPAIWRFAGPDIDHMERMDDGAYPEGLPLGWFLGGMWYDESDRKLYAPMHVEMEAFLREHPVARWNARKIALATSADKGKTWRYEGDILTPSTYYYNHDTYKFSGDCYSNGLADFGFYADVRSGYFYLFPEEAWISKGKFWGWWNTRVARCAMKDKMAPGAWRYFYNGTWDEPALGGKSSTVAPSHFWGIIYSTYLQRYISLFTSNGASTTSRDIDGTFIGTCSDLAKQDWVWGYCPDAMFGFLNVMNADGKTLTTCDRTFRSYHYFAGNTFQRLDFSLERGTTAAFDLAPRYSFEAHPESSDPVQSRATKFVGAQSPETKLTGAWVERADSEAYQGKLWESAAKGDSVELTFEGPAVYWRAVKSPESGRADVYLDGILRKTVDCYSPRSTSCLQFAYFITGLGLKGQHLLKIVVRGDKHQGSAGSTIGHVAFEYAAESYRASAGFCSLMGKNGWHYQQWTGAAYEDMQFCANDLVMTNYWFGDGDCVVGPQYQIPDDNASVRKWVAPHGGVVRVEGNLSVGIIAGDGVVAQILYDQAVLWPATRVAFGEPASHDVTVRAEQGNEIAFVVAKNSPKAHIDKVSWDPAITYIQAEPAVWKPNRPSARNLALHAYARSKGLVCAYRPYHAVDGLPKTAFVIHADDRIASGDDWLMLDLGWACMIDCYVVISRPLDSAYQIERFALQKSDDGFAWTEVDAVNGNREDRVERAVPEFSARYVRLYLPKGKPFCIHAFELYYTGGQPFPVEEGQL